MNVATAEHWKARAERAEAQVKELLVIRDELAAQFALMRQLVRVVNAARRQLRGHSCPGESCQHPLCRAVRPLGDWGRSRCAE